MKRWLRFLGPLPIDAEGREGCAWAVPIPGPARSRDCNPKPKRRGTGRMADILIIDDERPVCNMLRECFDRLDHVTDCSLTLEDGLRKAASKAFDVIFLDIYLPDGNGLHAIHKIRRPPSTPEVIVLSGMEDPEAAEFAIKSGAWDYIRKSAPLEKVRSALLHALQYRQQKQWIKPSAPLKREGIVGNSPKMKSCLDLLAVAAESEAGVLIAGETGTGKELFAQAIHENSRRAHKDFVILDCGALPETLVESVLFGHEKGAFTGADKHRPGLIKLADGGTLFLDEVGELPLGVQKAFLRVLQERRFRPVGSDVEMESNFRLVAATNQDLGEMVRAGKFREDLLFRVRSITIQLPSLRERTEDIEELVSHFLLKFCKHRGLEVKSLSPDFLETLAAHSWPGNVRELANAVERAVSMAHEKTTLFAVDLPIEIRVQAARGSVVREAAPTAPPADTAPALRTFPNLRAHLERKERQYLEELMSSAGGDVKQACQISGLSRSRLYERLKKYQISRHPHPFERFSNMVS